jgi:hypothetical protein
MTQTVIHQPRVAWDAALAFVRMTAHPYYAVFANEVYRQLGPDVVTLLEETRRHVLDNLVRTGGDRYVTDVEAAKWRVRLEEMLRTRPELAGALLDLTGMAPR